MKTTVHCKLNFAKLSKYIICHFILGSTTIIITSGVAMTKTADVHDMFITCGCVWMLVTCEKPCPWDYCVN